MEINWDYLLPAGIWHMCESVCVFVCVHMYCVWLLGQYGCMPLHCCVSSDYTEGCLRLETTKVLLLNELHKKTFSFKVVLNESTVSCS